MTLRTSFAALVLAGFAWAGTQPLPVEDPPPCIVKNGTSGLLATDWSIKVSDSVQPVGVIKIYDLDNNMLGAMVGPGDRFDLKPGQAIKVAVCPEVKPEGAVVSLTLDFSKASDWLKSQNAASLTFSQNHPAQARPVPVAYKFQPLRGKVKVDDASYLSAAPESPFLTLGK